MLDIAGFRADRKRELAELGERAVADVQRTNEAVKLAPMTAFERKVIHDVVSDAGLRSESEGEGTSRRVVVMPA
jgi:spoIIIJ-associated protein